MKYKKTSGEADVYLNGTLQSHVLEADDETGEILLAQTDYRTGKVIKNADEPYGCESVLVKGKVLIKMRESSSSSSSESYNPWGYPPYSCGVVEAYVIGLLGKHVAAQKRLIPEDYFGKYSSPSFVWTNNPYDDKPLIIRDAELAHLMCPQIIDRTEEDRKAIKKKPNWNGG
jgi:hypothetical protein